jgi:hypothetical protein
MLFGAPPWINSLPMDLYLMVSYVEGFGEIIFFAASENLLIFRKVADV